MRRRDMLVGGTAAIAATPALAFAPDAGARIRDAFLYGFAPFEVARLRGASAIGAHDALAYRAMLADHTFRAITAPNNDTIYASAYLDLGPGPFEISAPDMGDRYYSIAFMDLFTDNFAVLGGRETRGRAQRVVLAGPDWRGAVPGRVIRAPTRIVWMLVRTLVDGPADLAAADTAQHGVTLRRLPGGDAAAASIVADAHDATDPANFLAVVNSALAGARGANARRAGALASVGLVPGDPDAFAKLDPATQALWRTTAPGVLAELRSGAVTRAMPDGWSAPPPTLGRFGADDVLRARTALWGIGALPREEAMYISARVDSTGAPLDGSHAYVWRLPAGGAPVDSFWSLTMYAPTPEGRLFLVENPIARFSIGDRTPGIVRAADGSLAVNISNAPPADQRNWLPAPAGRFQVTLRAYLPKPTLRSGAWRPPPLLRA